MNAAPGWAGFLASQGARLDGEGVVDFGAPADELEAVLERPVLAELSALSHIEVSGADARSFLGGQLTADLRQPAPAGWTLAAWCSAQGRVLALFGVVDRGEAFDLLLPAEQLAAVLKRLRMFVLRAAVTLEDASQRSVRLGLAGPGAAELLAGLGFAVPAAPLEAAHGPDASLLRLHGERAAFLLVTPAASAPALWRRLSAGARPVGRDAWRLDRVLAGEPAILGATADRYLPQMLNLDALGGLSFSKGCYPGQEVIARLKYRGELKRRVFLAACPAPPPAPGTAIHRRGEAAEPAGEVLLSAPHPEGGCRLLAVVSLAAARGELALGAPEGPALTLCELPYAATSPL